MDTSQTSASNSISIEGCWNYSQEGVKTAPSWFYKIRLNLLREWSESVCPTHEGVLFAFGWFSLPIQFWKHQQFKKRGAYHTGCPWQQLY